MPKASVAVEVANGRLQKLRNDDVCYEVSFSFWFAFGHYEAYFKGRLASITAKTENSPREGRGVSATSFFLLFFFF